MNDAELIACVRDLVPEWSDEEISGFAYLDGGYSNSNYAFSVASKSYVLRMPERAQPFVDRGFEQAWYAQLPESFVKPVAFDVATGTMVSPWVEGTLLVDLWSDADDGSRLVQYVRDLHAALPVCRRDYDLIQMLMTYGDPWDQFVPASLGCCHNDLNPWNVIVTDSGWVTLDWEFVGNNDPLFDLVALHQGLALPLSSLAALAEEFLGKRDMPRLRSVYEGFWRREGAWAKHQIQLGNDRDGVREQLDDAQERLALTDDL